MSRSDFYRHTITQAPKLRSRQRTTLATLRDCRTGERHAVGTHQAKVLIGGDSDCDIVIQDPFASARHCTLQRLPGNSWQLSDHGSKNGTLINGTRVAVGELRHGSQLSIGDTCLELVSHANNKSARDMLLGNAPSFLVAVQKALKAARSRCSILILGETGTGKELFARAIHEGSRRAEHPFVPINCGSIPQQLVRSELFGHTKGSFTGATSDHEGLFKQAHTGTLFLDELGELPLDQQPHLLRALETRMIRAVGSPLEEFVDTRVVAATNRDCVSQADSPLREDLFHRLSAIVIELPPLRERSEDIPLLVRHFLNEGQDEFGPHLVDRQTLKTLAQHEWQGNIRELRNSVMRAMALGSQHLGVADFLPGGVVRPGAAGCEPSPIFTKLTDNLTHYERSQRALLAEAYQRLGSIRAAAKELGIPKSTLADMCKRYGINTTKKKRSCVEE